MNDLKQFYQTINERNLTPLWEVLDALVPPEPKTLIQPAIWHFEDIRDYILEAGQLVTAKEAVRRVLILENPAQQGQSRITQSIYAGLQLILPGEVAPSHRHSQTALRLVLDGEGAYTAVDGERTIMRHGDFIITPAYTWHDHGNEGNEPVIWLDGLDIPMVQFLEAGFMENAKEDVQTTTRPEGDALARYGSNMAPVDFKQDPNEPARIFVYPFAKTRSTLIALSNTDPDRHFGYKMRFLNPATGKSPIPTIGSFIQLLPAGYETAAYRATDSTVFACLEGSGVVEIAGESYAFNEKDVFVIPSWTHYRFQSTPDTFLFSFSDRPVQESLGLWREDKQ